MFKHKVKKWNSRGVLIYSTDLNIYTTAIIIWGGYSRSIYTRYRKTLPFIYTCHALQLQSYISLIFVQIPNLYKFNFIKLVRTLSYHLGIVSKYIYQRHMFRSKFLPILRCSFLKYQSLLKIAWNIFQNFILNVQP